MKLAGRVVAAWNDVLRFVSVRPSSESHDKCCDSRGLLVCDQLRCALPAAFALMSHSFARCIIRCRRIHRINLIGKEPEFE